MLSSETGSVMDSPDDNLDDSTFPWSTCPIVPASFSIAFRLRFFDEVYLC